MSDSAYDDQTAMIHAVRTGAHREVIGGLWDEVGALQFDFLKNHGLKPEYRFLDVGCGSLRAGVRLVPYLEPGNYWGIDINQSLLDAGWELELKPADLHYRQPRGQLVALQDFEFDRLNASFDAAIATSVFTHLNFNRIRRCLAKLSRSMVDGGVFYATFFEVPEGHDRETPLRHTPGDVVTHSSQDPFHYTRGDVEHMIEDLPWQMEWIGDWDHPRDQRMVQFTRV